MNGTPRGIWTECDESDDWCPGPTVVTYTKRGVVRTCPAHAAAVRRFARIEAKATKATK